MGPLEGVKVVELGSIGPGPFAAMVLSDLGADVVRLERPGRVPLLPGERRVDPVERGRPSLPVDLRSAEGRATLLELCAHADALIEGNRPGVLERLALGPEALWERAPQLVIGRMTGYGQDGPMAQVPGHDINYLALSGVLGAMARQGERPLFPLNLLGDYGSGGMLLALGVVCGVVAARTTGEGQVVDAAMVDGAAMLSTVIHGLRAAGQWSDAPGTNVLDSGAPFYEVYETADGRHLAVGAIEPQFYAALLEGLGLAPGDFPQWDRDRWPSYKARFAEVIHTRSRDAWGEVFEHGNACATPVLSLAEAPEHPHNRARRTFFEQDGVVQPAPAPRFSATPTTGARAVATAAEVLERWGVGVPAPAAG